MNTLSLNISSLIESGTETILGKELSLMEVSINNFNKHV